MASAIYKRTMRRGGTGNPEGTGTEEHPPSVAANQADARSPQNNESSARPLIGKRTLYVDRQVARRARARSKRKRIRRLRILVALLILSLIFVSMGWILSWARLQEETDKRVTLDSELRKRERELDKTQLTLEERERDLLNLVENRSPGLQQISYNKLLDVNDKYVLNVSFSEAGAGEDKALEYHTMLSNNSDEMLYPQVKVYIFNEFGLQVGIAQLEKEHATSDVVMAELEPGETRSYHSRIDVERDAVPLYYMIYVE